MQSKEGQQDKIKARKDNYLPLFVLKVEGNPKPNLRISSMTRIGGTLINTSTKPSTFVLNDIFPIFSGFYEFLNTQFLFFIFFICTNWILTILFGHSHYFLPLTYCGEMVLWTFQSFLKWFLMEVSLSKGSFCDWIVFFIDDDKLSIA